MSAQYSIVHVPSQRNDAPTELRRGPLPPVPPSSAIGQTLARAVAGTPADCNADEPVSGRACDLEAGHDGQHVAGLTWWTA